MSKYGPLADYLSRYDGPECALSFTNVEEIIGEMLPGSARLLRQWWQNSYGRSTTHVQARHGWHAAGWSVRDVDLAAERVVFVRSLNLR